jgi:hypothetical protein
MVAGSAGILTVRGPAGSIAVGSGTYVPFAIHRSTMLLLVGVSSGVEEEEALEQEALATVERVMVKIVAEWVTKTIAAEWATETFAIEEQV